MKVQNSTNAKPSRLVQIVSRLDLPAKCHWAESMSSRQQVKRELICKNSVIPQCWKESAMST